MVSLTALVALAAALVNPFCVQGAYSLLQDRTPTEGAGGGGKASISSRNHVANPNSAKIPRAQTPAQKPMCHKCTWEFCDNPTVMYRDQTTCNCKKCSNGLKPDPDTNAQCVAGESRDSRDRRYRNSD